VFWVPSSGFVFEIQVQFLASLRPRARVDGVENASRGVLELVDDVCVDHGRLGELAPPPIPGSARRRIQRIELAGRLAPGPNGGNNAREWRVVPKWERRRTGQLTIE